MLAPPQLLGEQIFGTLNLSLVFRVKAQMFAAEDLNKLATMEMPFGKYQGRLLIDLPEEYLLWFANKGWPKGQLGLLLQLALEIKINGLDYLIKPLRQRKH